MVFVQYNFKDQTVTSNYFTIYKHVIRCKILKWIEVQNILFANIKSIAIGVQNDKHNKSLHEKT